MNYAITTYFERGYISNAYTPELAKLIDVEKISGVNRARSEATKRKALEEYLRANGMTYSDYEQLKARAKDSWTLDAAGHILIPSGRVEAAMAQACDTLRSGSRPCEREQVRTLLHCSDWTTNRTASDGRWSRVVPVKDGAGNLLSNQRGLRENDYINKFEARGTIEFDPEFVKPSVLHQAWKFCGIWVGIGASRKMGYGRFDVRGFEKTSD